MTLYKETDAEVLRRVRALSAPEDPLATFLARNLGPGNRNTAGSQQYAPTYDTTDPNWGPQPPRPGLLERTIGDFATAAKAIPPALNVARRVMFPITESPEEKAQSAAILAQLPDIAKQTAYSQIEPGILQAKELNPFSSYEDRAAAYARRSEIAQEIAANPLNAIFMAAPPGAMVTGGLEGLGRDIQAARGGVQRAAAVAGREAATMGEAFTGPAREAGFAKIPGPAGEEIPLTKPLPEAAQLGVQPPIGKATEAGVSTAVERVDAIQNKIDQRISELLAQGKTFQEANNTPDVLALYERRFAFDESASKELLAITMSRLRAISLDGPASREQIEQALLKITRPSGIRPTTDTLTWADDLFQELADTHLKQNTGAYEFGEAIGIRPRHPNTATLKENQQLDSLSHQIGNIVRDVTAAVDHIPAQAALESGIGTAARPGVQPPIGKVAETVAPKPAEPMAQPGPVTVRKAVPSLSEGPPLAQAAAAGGGVPPVEPPTDVTPPPLEPPRPQRRPNFQAGARATPLEPRIAPPLGELPPTTTTLFPSGRKPGGIGNQKPLVTESPYLKTEAALTPTGKTFVQRINDATDSIVRGLFTPNAGLRDLPESSLGHPFSLAKVVPASAMKGGRIVKTEYTPVLEPVGDNLKDLQLYMVLQRDKDLLSGPHRTMNLPGGLHGIGDVLQAEKTLANKVGTEKFTQIKQVADQLYALNQKHVIQRLVDEGLLTQQDATVISAANRHYIPFQREDFVGIIENSVGRPTASVTRTGLKRLTEEGSERALHEPLAGLLAQPSRVEAVIARNKAAQALVESLQMMEKKPGELVNMVGPTSMAKEANIGGAAKPSLAAVENSNVVGTVSFFKDGQLYQAQVPAYYARIAKSMDAEVVSGFVNVMRAISQPFKAGVTKYNPAFPLVNLLRDATSFLFNGGLIPFGKDYWTGFRAVLKKTPDYEEAVRAGTLMSGLVENMESMQAMNRVLGRHDIGAFTIRSPKDVALIAPRLVRAMGRGIESANLVVEQTPRVGQYIAARKAGATMLEAGVKGRDVTVDFAQFGTVMRTVDAIFPFANPAMQGLYITARTIKTHPYRSAVIASAFMFPTVLSRVNNMRFETSEKIPDYLYQNNWVVQFGEFTDEKEERKPLYFKIPKGPIAGPATFPAEALFNAARKTEDRSAAELLWASGTGSLRALSPIEPSVGAMAPPVGTAIQAQAGKDFYTGQTIIPRGQETLPPEQQFGSETGKLAVALGQNRKISPRTIEFALQDYFGGAGQAVTWATDMLLGVVGYNPQAYGEGMQPAVSTQNKLARTPVVGRVFGTTGSQQVRRGWELFDQAVIDTQREFNKLPGVNTLGIRLGEVGTSFDMTPGVAGDSIDLTPKQRAEYQQMMAALVTPAMKIYLANLNTTLPVDKKKELIGKHLEYQKGIARNEFRRLLRNQERQIQSKTTPQQKTAIKGTAKSVLDQYRKELEPAGVK